MEKLIVNVPAFNKEAIQPDMFIQVKHTFDKKNTQVIKGVITAVEASRIFYVTSKLARLTIHLSSVLSGETTINVIHGFDEPKQSAVEHIVREASTGISPGYSRLDIRTNHDNHKIAGVSFKDVFVDGLRYVQAPNAFSQTPAPFTTDCEL